MKKIALAALVGGVLLAPAAAQDEPKAPTLEETLAWLKKLDVELSSAQKEPRFPNLAVENLRTLKAIKLGGHRKSDNKHVAIPAAEFRFLTALPALEKADLVEIDGLTDEALVHVGRIASLTDLNLGDGQISVAGVKHLLKLKSLTSLNLGWTKDVGDETLPLLENFPKLEVLVLGGTKVTDQGLPHLAKLPALKELRIPATAVTDAGLQSLAACKALTTVKIGKKSKVTPEGIARLKSASPNVSVLSN